MMRLLCALLTQLAVLALLVLGTLVLVRDIARRRRQKDKTPGAINSGGRPAQCREPGTVSPASGWAGKPGAPADPPFCVRGTRLSLCGAIVHHFSASAQ